MHYARIRGGAYKPQIRRFKTCNYVYLQYEAPTTLDVRARRIILRVKAILPSGIPHLVGNDIQECRDNMKNCAPCHQPIEGSINSELAMVPSGYRCFICGERKGEATMLLCHQC